MTDWQRDDEEVLDRTVERVDDIHHAVQADGHRAGTGAVTLHSNIA